ncbi:hypothetical protein Agub_g6047 [Astrephomene gubernaculifera]|uniref:Secreted protein n=1 Tax=Astrephomene gubernaculifera TaxID=47775 RepID=A0AAD3DQ85_9CHLO|nr:hypothetical protein Agub_g6047 [Astrephomene gubernaculifera]
MRVSVYTALLAAAACGLLLLPSCLASESQQDPKLWQIGSPLTCVKQKTPIDCDLLDECVWCSKPNSKIGAGCYPVAAARLLPKSFGIECDKDLNPPAASTTTSAPAATTTAATTSSSGRAGGLQGLVRQSACDGKPQAACVAPGCVWCTSAAVGGGCYTPDEAKLLPKAIFKCNAPTAVEA